MTRLVAVSTRQNIHSRKDFMTMSASARIITRITLLHRFLPSCKAGHGIYEQDIPAEWKWQPVGTTCSMGIHESQSRFIENIIGRSEAFWRHFLPILKHETGTTFDDVDLDVMFRAANDVKPSKIRIEADEVTYSLHVVLRFEMEQLIMDDQASIDELPQIWNEKMDKYFGIE